MKRIDLSSYPIGPNKQNNFDVRTSVVALLFVGKIDARELIRRDELAVCIENTEGDTLLVEDADYAKLVAGLNAADLTPFGREAVEFVKRILDAPTVEVAEK